MQNTASASPAGLTWMKKSRPTIGFVTLSLDDERVADVWAGAVDVARERDVSLVCLPGGGARGARSMLYDLVPTETLDGLVTFQWWHSQEDFEQVYERYRPLPVVNVMRLYEGYPGVAWDHRQVTYDLVSHLIEVHGCRRIAYIGLYQGHLVSQERHQAYVDALADHGIPPDPDLVVPADYPGPHLGGTRAVGYLLDDRGLQPDRDLEAVVSYNDGQALDVLDTLRERGVRVPQDVAIVGIDDLLPGAVSEPSLTTVAMPKREMGRRAVELVLQMIAGEEVPERVVLPSDLVVRRSCGCPSQAVVEAASELPPAAGRVEVDRETFRASLAAQREETLADITQAVGEPGNSADPGWAGHLLDAFVADLQAESEGAFLAALDGILRQAATTDRDPSAWHGALSALRRHLLPYLDDRALRRADGLWQQARVAIGETVQRALTRRQLEAERQARTLAEIGTSLITTFDVKQLMDVLAEEMPRLGIPSIYLALYENPQPDAYPQPAPEWSRLVLAYNERGRLEIDPEGQRFPSHSLLPAEILPRERRQVLVLEPLFFQEQQLGFVLLEVGPHDGAVYESLRGRTSSALQGALLMQQVKRHALQLDTAVSETLTTVQEMQTTVTETAKQARTVADAAQRSVDISQAGQAVVADAVTGMETIEQQVKTIEQNILALSERTEQIGGIIGAVKRIADQIQMLALNANIEAARFGSQGQGFAVVAREMRELAGQSREAAYRVRNILTEIQQATSTSVMVTKEGSQRAQDGMELVGRAGEAIRDLSATIEQAAQAATHIASTTYQQTSGMNRLAEAMQSIKQASAQTTMSTQQAEQGIE
jgi:DNA-binding LacI/PurR family transcriptional regulator